MFTTPQKCADFIEENLGILLIEILPVQRKENPIHTTVELRGILSFFTLLEVLGFMNKVNLLI